MVCLISQTNSQDDPAPAEEGGTDDSSPSEEGGTNDSAPSEEGGTDDSAPSEEGGTDDSAPSEEGGTDDSAPAEAGAGGTEENNGVIEETEGLDFPSSEIHLDPLESCYCPGDNSVPDSPLFKNKPADYKVLLAVISEKRREAHQNFTVSVIPEAVEELERSKLPTAAVLQDMFPDLGDGFVVKSYVESLSKITLKAVNDLKNLTATKMLQRLAASTAIRETVSKFDYSKFGPPPPATEPPDAGSEGDTQSVDNTDEEQPTQTGDNTEEEQLTPEDTSGEEASSSRKKRLVITSTTQVPPRIDVVHVVPERYGYGVVAFNATETLLNDSLVCHTCTPATLKRRKFLYFTTLFEDAWADVTTDEFKSKKILIEKAVDDLFFAKMSEYGISQKMTDAGDAVPGIPLIKGYMGCIVLSLFKSTSTSLGAGKRKKRGFREDGLGAEVEISFRSPTVSDEDIEVRHFY